MTYQEAIDLQIRDFGAYQTGGLSPEERDEYDEAKAFTDIVEHDYRTGLISSLDAYDPEPAAA